jgi:hypothetical protein
LDEIRKALALVDETSPKAKEQKASLRKASDAADKLRRLSKPFLNWAGKAERLSFDVPTLPMFVHERLSTKAILETLKGHKRDNRVAGSGRWLPGTSRRRWSRSCNRSWGTSQAG